MPMLAALLGAIAPWLLKFFASNAVRVFAWFLARLGIVIATTHFAVEPVVNLVVAKFSVIPSGMGCWLGAFGVLKAASVLLSAAGLSAGKKLFFTKKVTP